MNLQPMYFSQTDKFKTFVNSIKGCKSQILLTCPTCLKAFSSTKNDIQQKLSKQRHHKFCSIRCANKYKSITHTIELICLQCNTSFKRTLSDIYNPEKSFCSSSCSASYNNIGVSRNKKFSFTSKYKLVYQIKPKLKICTHPECKKQILNKSKYCIEHYNQTKKKIDLSSAKTDRIRRRILIDIKGHSCSVCNNNLWNTLPIPLELDHIDGHSDNNDDSNLRLICPNCHAQTKTYKGKNKGNSNRQVKRRERYQNGLTY